MIPVKGTMNLSPWFHGHGSLFFLRTKKEGTVPMQPGGYFPRKSVRQDPIGSMAVARMGGVELADLENCFPMVAQFEWLALALATQVSGVTAFL